MRPIALAGLLLWTACLGGAPAETPAPVWADFEPALTELVGLLEQVEYFGPPNYGATPDQDRRERAIVLRLDVPIYIRSTPDDELNGVALENLERIQLVLPPDLPLTLLGRRVRARGELYTGHTGHHIAPAVLRTRTIELVAVER